MRTTGQKGGRSKSVASGLRNLALACGLLLEGVSRPAAADACSEFRIALALEDVSSHVLYKT